MTVSPLVAITACYGSFFFYFLDTPTNYRYESIYNSFICIHLGCGYRARETVFPPAIACYPPVKYLCLQQNTEFNGFHLLSHLVPRQGHLKIIENSSCVHTAAVIYCDLPYLRCYGLFGVDCRRTQLHIGLFSTNEAVRNYAKFRFGTFGRGARYG